MRYLLELGANPNDKPNGGSAALDGCLSTSLRCESVRWEISPHWYVSSSKASKYSVSKTLKTFELLLEHGALLRPDNDKEIACARRSLFECEPDVTLKLVDGLVKRGACTPDTIQNLLRTPAMKKHLTPVAQKLVSLGFDVRTPEQKIQDERQEEAYSKWALQELVSRYSREEIYREIWLEPIRHVAKRYKLSDVGFAKVCKKLNIPRPGLGYWAKRAAGKPVPKQPPLPKLMVD